MEECVLRRLPKDILIKLISDIQNPDKMSDQYIVDYNKKVQKSINVRKFNKVKPLLKNFYRDFFKEDREDEENIFDKLGEIGLQVTRKVVRMRFIFHDTIVTLFYWSGLTQRKGFTIRKGGVRYVKYTTEIVTNDNNELNDNISRYINEEYDEKTMGKYSNFGLLTCLNIDGINFILKLRNYLDPETDIKNFGEIFQQK